MIFKFAEIRCTFGILKILSKNKSKYSIMFKETKVSHITLQRALRFLISKKFILKHDISHMNVDYEITEKGRKLLRLFVELNEITI